MYHSGALLGGWWYAVQQGSNMIGVSDITYSIMPPKLKEEKCGSIMMDLELIRMVGRELWGDIGGTKLQRMEAAPLPMIEWLRGVSSTRARTDYKNWGDILTKSFGPRKFVEMNFTADELYSKIKRGISTAVPSTPTGGEDEVSVLGLIGLLALSEYDFVEYRRATDFSKFEIKRKIEEMLKELPNDSESAKLYQEYHKMQEESRSDVVALMMKQLYHTAMLKADVLAVKSV